MKALDRFTKKRFKRLLALLKAFPAGKEKEELHQIRLEIKKIKVLLRLIHFNDKEFRDHKHFIPFRTIFRETGHIRDTNMRKELLDQYTQIHTPFFRSPDKKLKQFKVSLTAHIKTLRKENKVVMKEIRKIKSHTYAVYLDKKHDELNEHLSERFTQKNLHRLRKLIKEITYLTSVKMRKNKIDPFLIESADLIGNWHDKKVLIPWIRTEIPDEKNTINTLQSECNSDMQQLRKLIAEHKNHNRMN